MNVEHMGRLVVCDIVKPGPLLESSQPPRQPHCLTLQTSEQGSCLLKYLPMVSRTRRNVWVWLWVGYGLCMGRYECEHPVSRGDCCEVMRQLFEWLHPQTNPINPVSRPYCRGYLSLLKHLPVISPTCKVKPYIIRSTPVE